jgi:uncharacterized protein (DUF488 family)
MIKLYTIGFTGKSAESFFNLLRNNNVKCIIDTRINNVSQLAGFAKSADLAFFAKEIGNINYKHIVEFAPTKELLSRYRDKKLSWAEYEVEYLNLLDMRRVSQKTNIEELNESCLLCSEHTPEKCHRRLLAEYFRRVRGEVQILHLIR